MRSLGALASVSARCTSISPGKDALTVALIQRETARFYDDARGALAQRSGKATLEYLIGAAVRQQLQQPMLARLLDVEEGRPALRDEASKPQAFHSLLIACIKRAKPLCGSPEVAAGDVAAIIRGMVDAAGERGEDDVPALEHRLGAAVFGYLARVQASRPRPGTARM